MIFKGLQIAALGFGVINNLLFLHLFWLENYHPKLGDSIFGKSSFDLMFTVSFLSVIAAIIFRITLTNNTTISNDKKQYYYISLFLLNIFSLLLVLFVLMFMIFDDNRPWFG